MSCVGQPLAAAWPPQSVSETSALTKRVVLLRMVCGVQAARSTLGLRYRVAVLQPRIHPAALQQFGMPALLNDAARFHHHHAVGVLDGA